MAKKKKAAQTAVPTTAAHAADNSKQWLAIGAIVIMLGAAASIFYRTFWATPSASPSAPPATASATTNNPAAPANGNPTQPGASPAANNMNIAQAVMVTDELDFGQPVPTIAQALLEIERGYVPDDGIGRTFAILDAYGEPTLDGKLHISMHVSSEKPGIGFLRFKRTGQIIWQSRIGNPGDAPAGAKSLNIYMDNGAGGSFVLDGQRGGASVLDVYLQSSTQKVRDVWPDKTAREFTYVYSACGCPVKVQVRREGERTERVRDLPVIFPDDPAVVQTIAQLMKW